MTTWKPYIFEGREFLDARKIQSWEDIANAYPGVQIPRSEQNKPYLRSSYQEDEWSWTGYEPPSPWNPTWPSDPFTPPEGTPPVDPPDGGNPCEADDTCKYLGIYGPKIVECGGEGWYKSVLVTEGCAAVPGYVSWSAPRGNIRAVGVGARWTAPECCNGDVIIIEAVSAGCRAEFPVTLDCVDCCEQFSLTGAATVNPGATWTGTINPPCPGATCEVVSNSGCTLACVIDDAGSQVQVTTDANDCGSFTVTVTESGGLVEGCQGYSATKAVRINNTGQGGSWTSLGSPTNCTAAGTCCSSATGTCTCGTLVGVPLGCVVDECKYNGVGGTGTLCMCVNAPWCCTSPLSTRPCSTACPNPCGQSCATTCPAPSCPIPPGSWTGECKIQWTSQEWRCAC